MLSLARCRGVLGSDSGLEDPELELLRNQLYTLGRAVIDAHLTTQRLRADRHGAGQHSATSVASGFIGTEFVHFLADLPDEDRDLLIERAAIVEFDGGISRHEAEVVALREYRALKEH